MRKILSGVLSLVVMLGCFMAVMPEKVYACSCAVNSEPLEALQKAESVFAGKVLSTKWERKQKGIIGTIEYRDANLFEVQEAWKGVNQSQAIVYDNGPEASCGYDFEEGKTYLVYTYKDRNGDVYTSLCNRTVALSSASGDLVQLGQGSPPSERVSLEGKMRWISSRDYDLEVIAGLAVVLAGVLFLVIKRARSVKRK